MQGSLNGQGKEKVSRIMDQPPDFQRCATYKRVRTRLGAATSEAQAETKRLRQQHMIKESGCNSSNSSLSA